MLVLSPIRTHVSSVEQTPALDIPTRWFDVRRSNPKHDELVQLLEKRVIMLKAKGCSAVEYDNMDSWQNKALNGVRVNSRNMFYSQIMFNMNMAVIAHTHGLGAGLKVNVVALA